MHYTKNVATKESKKNNVCGKMGGISPIVKNIGAFCGDFHGALLPSSN
jgi:hypothetical protein